MSGIIFIHAADLHLDSPFSGLKHVPPFWTEKLRKSPFKAFQKIIDAALTHQVDFLLLSGDLFDGENRSLRTQVRFREEMERLNQCHIPVYIIHGNHDHLSGSWVKMDFPNNVHVFSEQTEVKCFQKKDRTSAHIYGFSYPKRHVTNRMIDSYIKQEGADFHIGMLHGNLEGLTGHSPYAPFSLHDLSAKDFDYWALGHIHKRKIISENPLAIYPGIIQGRHRKESGEKGCYLIELNKNGHQEFTFIETSEIIWDKALICLPDETNFDGVLAACRHELEQKQGDKVCYLLELVVKITDVKERSLLSNHVLEDMLAIIQEEAKEEEWNCWPFRMTIQDESSYRGAMQETPFTAELIKQSEEYSSFDEALEPLYRHASAKKYLDTLTEEDKKQLLIDSKQLLFQWFSE